MKKTFRLFFAAVAAIVFASCADKMGNEINAPEGGATVQDGDLVQMTFSASMSEDVDSKTTYLSRKVYWEATDAITVFSVGESVTKTRFADPELLENRAIARFSGLADASAETYYAVYPHSEANTYADGTFSVVFPDTHTAVANGFPSGSNVSVAVSVKDAETTGQNLQFKNVGALLSFSFNTAEDAANTKSVTFQARKSADDAQTPEFWGLTGNVTITIDENGLPIASEGSEDHVTVTAPVGGFEHGKAYFIPVCPVGDCTGMVVTFTDQNDDVYVKNNNGDFQLLRSYMFNVGKVLYPYDNLPDEIVLHLDFAGRCPFVEGDYVAPESQDPENGESYTYRYSKDGITKDFTFKFYARKAESTYYLYRDASNNAIGLYAGGEIKPNNCSIQILTPGIENRYLSEVAYSTAKGTGATNTRMVLSNALNGGKVTSAGSNLSDSWTFPYTESNGALIQSEAGKSYVVRARDAKTVIVSLTLTYTKTKPE